MMRSGSPERLRWWPGCPATPPAGCPLFVRNERVFLRGPSEEGGRDEFVLSLARCPRKLGTLPLQTLQAGLQLLCKRMEGADEAVFVSVGQAAQIRKAFHDRACRRPVQFLEPRQKSDCSTGFRIIRVF